MTRQDEIRAELADIDRLPDPTHADVERQRSLILEYGQIDKERQRARVADAAADPINREPATGELGRPLRRRANYVGSPWEVDVTSPMTTRSEITNRAMDLVEQHARSEIFGHDRAEAATRRIERDLVDPNLDVAKHVLLTGTDQYRADFERYLRDPQGMSYRAALSLTLANGGYLLPYVLDPTLVLTNAGSSNPLRQVSRVEQTTSNAWQGVFSTGVNAAWYPEGTTVADATPTVGQIKVTPNKAAAWVFGSVEVLADTNFADQLPSLFADAKDRLELGSFTTGSGTNEPSGFITTLGTSTGATTGTQTPSTVAASGMFTLNSVLAPRWRQAPGYAAMTSLQNLNTLRQAAAFSGSTLPILQGNTLAIGAAGVPIYENSAMVTASTGTNVVVFGDWNQNIIVDRVGVSVIYEPLVSASGSYLPSGQQGWFMFWRAGTTLTTTGTGDGPFRGLKA